MFALAAGSDINHFSHEISEHRLGRSLPFEFEIRLKQGDGLRLIGASEGVPRFPGLPALVVEDLKDPVYQSLDAVREGRIYGVMPYNWYANNYDTVLADAYYIGKTLYPDQFADIDPDQKADEIYTMLDGKPVYGDMKTLFGGFEPFSSLEK